MLTTAGHSDWPAYGAGSLRPAVTVGRSGGTCRERQDVLELLRAKTDEFGHYCRSSAAARFLATGSTFTFPSRGEPGRTTGPGDLAAALSDPAQAARRWLDLQ